MPAEKGVKVTIFDRNPSLLTRAAVANVLGSPPRLEQSVFAEGITRESAQHLGELAQSGIAARHALVGGKPHDVQVLEITKLAAR